MENPELDQLLQEYKAAVEEWIAAIRAEEATANPNHSPAAIDTWERAGFAEEDARNTAKKARQSYEDALRKLEYNF